MKNLAVIVALVLSVGCGAARGPVIVNADDAITDGLLRVKTGIDFLCSNTAPVLSVEQCKPLYSALTPALESGAAFNRLGKEQKLSGLGDLASAVARLFEAVKAVPSQYQGTLQTNLREVLRVATGV